MELKDFISGSLIQIAKAINTAIEEADSQKLNLRVNPIFSDLDEDWDKYRQEVEFDIAVTASDTSSIEGKGGIRIWVVDGGIDASRQTEATTVSRIKFSVPVLLPAHRTIAKK